MNHFTDSKISAGIFSPIIICSIAIGVWWRYDEPKESGISQNDTSQTVRVLTLTGVVDSDHGSVKPSSENNRVGDRNTSSSDDRHESKTEPIDLTETSWRNPFTKAHWMPLKSSETGQTAAATFLRPYRKLSIDLQIERPMPTGAFEIRIAAPDSKTMLFAAMTETQLEISAVEPKRRRTVLKRYSLKIPVSVEKSTHLRFSATGNRIIIFHNNRKVLTCNQPAGLSNRAVHFSLLSRGSSCRITLLRIDGE